MYLKPCPICGEKAAMSEAVADRTGYYCECYACDKSTDEFSSKQAAEDAWNRSEAWNLKDTALRNSYAIIINPSKTFRYTFLRFFLTLLGLFLAGTLIATLNSGFMGIFIGALCIFAAFWTAVGAYYYIKYLKKLLPPVSRLVRRARILNLTTFILANLSVLCAYAALVWFIAIPFVEKCRY